MADIVNPRRLLVAQQAVLAALGGATSPVFLNCDGAAAARSGVTSLIGHGSAEPARSVRSALTRSIAERCFPREHLGGRRRRTPRGEDRSRRASIAKLANDETRSFGSFRPAFAVGVLRYACREGGASPRSGKRRRAGDGTADGPAAGQCGLPVPTSCYRSYTMPCRPNLRSISSRYFLWTLGGRESPLTA